MQSMSQSVSDSPATYVTTEVCFDVTWWHSSNSYIHDYLLILSAWCSSLTLLIHFQLVTDCVTKSKILVLFNTCMKTCPCISVDVNKQTHTRTEPKPKVLNPGPPTVRILLFSSLDGYIPSCSVFIQSLQFFTASISWRVIRQFDSYLSLGNPTIQQQVKGQPGYLCKT